MNNLDDETWHPPEAKTTSGVHGAITDSSTLFTPDKGYTGKEFWTNVSKTEAAAVFSVVGTPFDRNATFESLMLSGEPESAIIVDKLRIGRESDVLEIGVGVARLAWHMTQMCRHFTGCDISPNMLEISRKNLKGRTNFTLQELAETGPLPFADAAFDAVYAQAVFIHLDREDAYRYIRESFRVLKPGGRAYFQFYNLLQDEGFSLFDWVSQFACLPDGKVRGRIQCATHVEVREYVERSGFVVDESTSHLEPREQYYKNPVPMLNYDYYLIAVADKPSEDGAPNAVLLPDDQRIRADRFSDEYCRVYLNGFFEKVGRVAADLFGPMQKFIESLPLPLALNVVHEVERGVKRCLRKNISPLLLLGPVTAAVNAESSLGTLQARVREAVSNRPELSGRQ